jgi:hypothetical protein
MGTFVQPPLIQSDREKQEHCMAQFEWLQERLAHDDLDHTVILTFARRGSWMGLRILEYFQLTGDGNFLWEWEDVYGHVPYRRQTCVLARPTTAALFHLFQAGLPSLLPFHEAQPLPALLPDALPAFFSISIADHHARYFYPLDTRHRSTVRPMGGPAHTIALELKRLLDQFVHLRAETISGSDTKTP